MTTGVGSEIRLDGSFEQTVDRVTGALKEQGFGILTSIDVKKAFDEKLGVDFRKYAILGACNPKLAHRALSERADVGLLLPCNVTVEEADGGTVVRIVDPRVMLGASDLADDPEIAGVAAEASRLLEAAAQSLSSHSDAG